MQQQDFSWTTHGVKYSVNLHLRHPPRQNLLECLTTPSHTPFCRKCGYKAEHNEIHNPLHNTLRRPKYSSVTCYTSALQVTMLIEGSSFILITSSST